MPRRDTGWILLILICVSTFAAWSRREVDGVPATGTPFASLDASNIQRVSIIDRGPRHFDFQLVVNERGGQVSATLVVPSAQGPVSASVAGPISPADRDEFLNGFKAYCPPPGRRRVGYSQPTTWDVRVWTTGGVYESYWFGNPDSQRTDFANWLMYGVWGEVCGFLANDVTRKGVELDGRMPLDTPPWLRVGPRAPRPSWAPG